VGYLPSRKLTVAVVTTYRPEAFENEGNYKNASNTIFASLGNTLAANTLVIPGHEAASTGTSSLFVTEHSETGRSKA
jgi:hypothetical protein